MSVRQIEELGARPTQFSTVSNGWEGVLQQCQGLVPGTSYLVRSMEGVKPDQHASIGASVMMAGIELWTSRSNT